MIKILLVSLTFLNLVASEVIPTWYPFTISNTIISYGDGKSFDEAKNSALLNIKKENNLLTNIKASDIEVLEEEVLEDKFFLKVKYINLSLMEQLNNSMKKSTVKLDKEINKYLLNTELLKDLNASFGYFPDIKIEGQYLYMDEERFLIKDDEFSSLLPQFQSKDIALEIKETILDNEKYFIKLSPVVDGYVTLIQILNNTSVEVLFSNKILLKEKSTIFPNFKLSDGLEVTLPEDVDSSKIFTMAIICEQQKDFSGFNNMFLSISGKKYMFGNLINEIEDCNYHSILTTIKK